MCIPSDAPASQLEQMLHEAQAMYELGQAEQAQALAEATLAHAQAADLPAVLAEGEALLGELASSQYDYDRAIGHLTSAIDYYRALHDQLGEARVLCSLGTIHRLTGAAAPAREAIELALELAHLLGNQPLEAEALSELGHLSSDYAQQRATYEQALALREALGDQAGQSRSLNHLGLMYWLLGLYDRARTYLEQAAALGRALQHRTSLAYCLESLGRVYLELGEHQLAAAALDEGHAYAVAIGDQGAEAPYWLVRGRLALERGHTAQAIEQIAIACRMQRQLCLAPELATSLAWLGMAYLSHGDTTLAERYTAEATEILAAIDNNSNEYPAQQVWWLHYQALRAHAPSDAPPAEAAWASLVQAHTLLSAALATISDNGMRRHYLNRVAANQAIGAEVARWAPYHADELHDSLRSAPAGQASDMLRRLLQISVRLNTIRDSAHLFGEVLDHMIELSGAERGFLELAEEGGQLACVAARGFLAAEVRARGARIYAPAIADVVATQQARLHAAPTRRPGRPLSTVRSIICLPLVARSRLIGLLYVDHSGMAGHFTRADVDLLMIFASQAAAAIDNDRLHQQTIQAKREIEAAAHTLEQRVAMRTAELAHARDAAEAANRAKSTFLANMSHELRTPLTAILGYADLIQFQAEEQGAHMLLPDLKVIRESGQHLLSLISNVLDLSKIEAGKVEITPLLIDVPDLVRSAAHTVLPLAQEHGNRLHVDCPAAFGTLYIDALKLRQVLLNLLSNACKFTQRGTITLAVQREGQPAAPGDSEPATAWVSFSVTDTGIGIVPEQLERLFQPFSQIQIEGAPARRGAGLGLALTRHLCQMMGGEVSVRSVPGEGSCFTVRLPQR